MSLPTPCLVTESRNCTVAVSSFPWHLRPRPVPRSEPGKIHVAKLPVRSRTRLCLRELLASRVNARVRRPRGFRRRRRIPRMLLVVLVSDLDLCPRGRARAEICRTQDFRPVCARRKSQGTRFRDRFDVPRGLSLEFCGQKYVRGENPSSASGHLRHVRDHPVRSLYTNSLHDQSTRSPYIEAREWD